jgi:NhaP-type Na+/H+ or K+/H+ antiporter
MIPLFLGLTLVNLLCLGTATALGYMSLANAGESKGVHILAGALGTLVCIGVHCVVFTYFIATAKWIQHAVRVKKLDAALVTPTRSFKRQAFPAALLAMAIVFATAVLGAARDNYGIPRIWHHSFALAALLVNVSVAAIEYRAIVRNGLLVDTILAQINVS